MTHFESEQHTDVIDQASAIEMRTTQGLISEVQARCKPQQAPRADGSYAVTDCEECGNEIGAERLKVAIKNFLCVHCASAQEKRKGR